MYTKQTLKKNNIFPSKKLGQNFLISRTIIKRIVSCANLKENDAVLEIGPGLGALTRELAKKVKRVIAVEKDKRLATMLDIKNVEVINDDALNFQPNLKRYKIISNLPYSSGLAILMRFLETDNPPEQMFIMLQKEIAQRLCSVSPRMQKIGVFCQFFSDPKIKFFISKNSFTPKPKVDSALIEIKNIKKPNVDIKLFSKIVNTGFSHPRKILLNNLVLLLKGDKEKTISWLQKNQINPQQRAQTLLVDNWINLTKTFVVE